MAWAGEGSAWYVRLEILEGYDFLLLHELERVAWHTVRFMAQFAAWRQHSRGPDAFSDWRVLGRMVHNWCSEPKQYSHENSVMLGFLYVYLEPAPHPPVSRGLFHKQPSKMGCLIFSFNYFSFVFTNFTDFFFLTGFLHLPSLSLRSAELEPDPSVTVFHETLTALPPNKVRVPDSTIAAEEFLRLLVVRRPECLWT